MSLIHDAIRRAERETVSGALGAAVPGHAKGADAEPVQWVMLVAFGLVSVVGMATLGWWHWGVNANTLPTRPAIALAAKPLTVAPREMPLPQVTVDVPAFVAPVSQPMVFGPKAAPVDSSPEVKNAVSVPRTLPQPVRDVALPTQPAQLSIKDVVVAPPKETSVGTHLASFVQQMTAGDLAQAQVELRSIQAKTRPSATVRVRAEAWFDLSSGNIAAAKAAYISLLARHPGDEEASINLASLEAAGNDRDAARTILAEAFRKNPASDALRDALQRFNATAGS